MWGHGDRTLLHDRIETGTEGRYWWVADGGEGEGGHVGGFCLQTPFDMLPGTTRMSAGALDVLVPAVIDVAGDLPGVVGEAGTAAGFAGRFATLRKVGAEPIEGTSNSVYQRIGYEPVMEVVRYRFG